VSRCSCAVRTAIRDSRSSSARAIPNISGGVRSGLHGTREDVTQLLARLVSRLSQAQSSSGAMRWSTHLSPIRADSKVFGASPASGRSA